MTKRKFKITSTFDESEPIDMTAKPEETKATETKEETPSKSIDELFQGYKTTPLEVEQPHPETPDIGHPTSDELSDPTKYYQKGPKKGQPKPEGTVKKMKGMYVTGAILLVMTDLLLPMGIAFIHNKFVKKEERVNPNALKFSVDQRNELREIADEVATYLNLYVNPLVLYFLTVVYYYWQNLLQHKTKI